jgi:hypothetical protein
MGSASAPFTPTPAITRTEMSASLQATVSACPTATASALRTTSAAATSTASPRSSLTPSAAGAPIPNVAVGVGGLDSAAVLDSGGFLTAAALGAMAGAFGDALGRSWPGCVAALKNATTVWGAGLLPSSDGVGGLRRRRAAGATLGVLLTFSVAGPGGLAAGVAQAAAARGSPLLSAFGAALQTPFPGAFSGTATGLVAALASPTPASVEVAAGGAGGSVASNAAGVAWGAGFFFPVAVVLLSVALILRRAKRAAAAAAAAAAAVDAAAAVSALGGSPSRPGALNPLWSSSKHRYVGARLSLSPQKQRGGKGGERASPLVASPRAASPLSGSPGRLSSPRSVGSPHLNSGEEVAKVSPHLSRAGDVESPARPPLPGEGFVATASIFRVVKTPRRRGRGGSIGRGSSAGRSSSASAAAPPLTRTPQLPDPSFKVLAGAATRVAASTGPVARAERGSPDNAPPADTALLQPRPIPPSAFSSQAAAAEAPAPPQWLKKTNTEGRTFFTPLLGDGAFGAPQWERPPLGHAVLTMRADGGAMVPEVPVFLKRFSKARRRAYFVDAETGTLRVWELPRDGVEVLEDAGGGVWK